MVEAYPLKWPIGWPRSERREYARFHTSFFSALVGIRNQLSSMEAAGVVISSNIPVRKDGLPYSSFAEPRDSGLAVYFIKDGKEQCIPCDRWFKIADNAQAINLTLEALRGLDRWGAKSMIDAAFRGFEALPDYTNGVVKKDYFKGMDRYDASLEYRRLVKTIHPDKGGDAAEFAEMQRQYDKLME